MVLVWGGSGSCDLILDIERFYQISSKTRLIEMYSNVVRGMAGSPYQQIGQMKKYLELEDFQHSSEILSSRRLRLWNLPDVKTNFKNIVFLHALSYIFNIGISIKRKTKRVLLTLSQMYIRSS